MKRETSWIGKNFGGIDSGVFRTYPAIRLEKKEESNNLYQDNRTPAGTEIGSYTKITAFWAIAPWSLVEVSWGFSGPCCFLHQSDFWTSARLHGVTTHKTATFTLVAVRNWNIVQPLKCYCWVHTFDMDWAAVTFFCLHMQKYFKSAEKNFFIETCRPYGARCIPSWSIWTGAREDIVKYDCRTLAMF